MPSQTVWLIVAVVAVVIVLLVLFLVLRNRGQRPRFEPRALPADEVETREGRIDEIERMFVSRPREAVAAARLLVDEMLTKMGYPVRLTANERARDLRAFNRAHSDRYRAAGELKDDANTEEMRRALKGYLDTARDIVAEARGRAGHGRPAREDAGAVAAQERPMVEERQAVTEERTVVEEHPPTPGDRPAAPEDRR